MLHQPCKTAGVVASKFRRAIDGPAGDRPAHLGVLQVPVLQIAHHAADAFAPAFDIAGHKGVVSGRVVHHGRAHHALRMADQAAHPLIAFDQSIGVAAVLNGGDRLLQVAHHPARALGVGDVGRDSTGDRACRRGVAHPRKNQPSCHTTDRVHARHHRRGLDCRQRQERAIAAPGVTEHAAHLAVGAAPAGVVVLSPVVVIGARVIEQLGARHRARGADVVQAPQPTRTCDQAQVGDASDAACDRQVVQFERCSGLRGGAAQSADKAQVRGVLRQQQIADGFAVAPELAAHIGNVQARRCGHIDVAINPEFQVASIGVAQIVPQILYRRQAVVIRAVSSAKQARCRRASQAVEGAAVEPGGVLRAVQATHGKQAIDIGEGHARAGAGGGVSRDGDAGHVVVRVRHFRAGRKMADQTAHIAVGSQVDAGVRIGHRAITAHAPDQAAHIEAADRIAGGIAVARDAAAVGGADGGAAVTQGAFKKADQAAHIVLGRGDVGGGIRALHRVAGVAAWAVVQANQAADIASAGDAGADVAGIFDGVALLPTHQAAHKIAALRRGVGARGINQYAACGVDGAGRPGMGHIAVLIADQAAHVMAAYHIAGGNRVGHRGAS